jgi:hypothetical protein
LEAATKSFDAVDVRTRQINKKLSGVEALPLGITPLMDSDELEDLATGLDQFKDQEK